ncbi:MAG: 3-dehydroquinate synthase [bacterium]
MSQPSEPQSAPAAVAPVRRLEVRLAGRPDTRYPVLFGRGAFGQVAAALPRERHGLAIVSEDRVWSHWGEPLLAALAPLGEPLEHYLFPAGESHKTRETKAALEEQLLARAWGRDVIIVALGGGVVTDLAGFVAATYLRGVRYVSLPTTLLAMVDAALGGKTGVNTAAGKNLIGSFHQPSAVICDLQTLDTLPDAELDNGLAETVKHAAMADAELLDRLVKDAAAVRGRSPEVLLEVTVRSASIKAEVVRSDEQDHGVRQALNFGHTIGHALERASSFRLSHGHAVALGMCVEAAAAAHAGRLASAEAERLVAALEALALPTRLPPGLDPDAILQALGVDKKNRRGEVRYALPERLGVTARFDGQYTTTLPRDAVLHGLMAHS